jgi:hypothetical protein
MTAVEARRMPAGFNDAVAAHLDRVARATRTTQQLLSSAYAQRLSLLRSDASDVELAESARLIARLEVRYRNERHATQNVIDVRDARDSSARPLSRVEPSLYLG